MFHGSDFVKKLKRANQNNGATIFLYPVSDPSRYGIAELDINNKITSITEKPYKPKSKYAVTGLYFSDEKVIEFAKNIEPSARGELEITTINELYLKENNLNAEIMGRGSAWLDTGTFESLSEASTYIQTLQKRQGLIIGCPEEISWNNKWINDDDLKKLVQQIPNTSYGNYLYKLTK